MGSLPLHAYFSSPPLPPHSFAPSSFSIMWNRRLALTVRIGWGLAGPPQLGNQRRSLANNLWEFCTQKPRAASPYLQRQVAYNHVRNDPITPPPPPPPPPPHRPVEPKTQVQFPAKLMGTKRLAGLGAVEEREMVGVGKKRRSDPYAYAFGLYADKHSLKKQLSVKYGNRSPEELKTSEEFYKDVVENDLDLTVRLEIVEIDCLRSAFKEHIGSRLQNLSGTQKEILERFTSQFNDDGKLKRGTTIDFVRHPGHILKTKINNKEIGSIQCEPLCRSLFDLYIGEDPLDKEAKKNIGSGLASLLNEK